MSDNWFIPSIIKKGTSKQTTLGGNTFNTVSLLQNGLAGWSFEDGIDLSDYQKLVVKMRRTPGKGNYFRFYDSGSLFGDYYEKELTSNSTTHEFDLHELVKASGDALNPAHIRFAGFSTKNSDAKLYVSEVYLVKEDTGIDTLESDATDAESYLDLMGRPVSNPTNGIFIRRSDRKKVFIP